MSQVTITIDEQDLPTVLEMLREKGIAVAQPQQGQRVGGRVGRRLRRPKVVGLAAGSATSKARPDPKPSA